MSELHKALRHQIKYWKKFGAEVSGFHLCYKTYTVNLQIKLPQSISFIPITLKIKDIKTV